MQKKPVGRPPKQENQRARILDAAARLFATVGYDRCSMAEIAAALNITKPAVYHYFRTKQEIFDTIRESNVQELYDSVLAGIPQDGTATEQLRALMIGHAEFFENNYWKVVAQLTGHGGLLLQNQTDDERFLAHRRDYESMVKRIFTRGVESGEFKDINVGSATRAVLSMINWMIRWYRPEGDKQAKEIAIEYFDLITNGIAR